jgi:hypothetical protein
MTAEDGEVQTHAHVEESPARQSGSANDVAYLSICSGCLLTANAAEGPKFVRGQLVVLAVAGLSSAIALLIYSLWSLVAL